MAVRRTRLVRSATRRQTAWIGLTLGDTTITSAVKSVVGSLNAAALALRPFTVIRTHLEIFLRSDQSAADELQSGAVGTCIVNDDAVAVGITAIPGPVSDLGSDVWFAHQIVFGDAVSLADRTVGGAHFTLDSKAMRKVGIGQDLVVMLENAVATGMVVTMGGRFLVKLH